MQVATNRPLSSSEIFYNKNKGKIRGGFLFNPAPCNPPKITLNKLRKTSPKKPKKRA